MLYLILLLLEIFVLYLLMRKVSNRIFNFIYRITKNKKVTVYIFAVLFLPGTFVHEMSHFLTALFLLVPVRQIDLMPTFEEGVIKMGSVPIGKTDPLRRTLIGVAPIIFGLVIIFITTSMALPVIIHGIIAFEVGNTMFSSKKDLEGSLLVGIVAVIIYAALYFLGLRITINVSMDILQKADLFLLVPIIIDFII